MVGERRLVYILELKEEPDDVRVRQQWDSPSSVTDLKWQGSPCGQGCSCFGRQGGACLRRGCTRETPASFGDPSSMQSCCFAAKTSSTIFGPCLRAQDLWLLRWTLDLARVNITSIKQACGTFSHFMLLSKEVLCPHVGLAVVCL